MGSDVRLYALISLVHMHSCLGPHIRATVTPFDKRKQTLHHKILAVIFFINQLLDLYCNLP